MYQDILFLDPHLLFGARTPRPGRNVSNSVHAFYVWLAGACGHGAFRQPAPSGGRAGKSRSSGERYKCSVVAMNLCVLQNLFSQNLSHFLVYRTIGQCCHFIFFPTWCTCMWLFVGVDPNSVLSIAMVVVLF